jgi:hypothetical protein
MYDVDNTQLLLLPFGAKLQSLYQKITAWWSALAGKMMKP